ncbi:MAG: c-type cytochrome [Opitutus sp.]|nr:c-type cytochrome [Opitutus sp.]
MKPSRALAGVICAAIAASFASAVEPWADQNLPVQDGLALWLEAGRIERGGAQLARPSPANGPLAFWPDASGKKRHARQDDPARQPVLETKAAGAVVRFDGVDDLLEGDSSGKVIAATVFIVASAEANPGGFRTMVSFHAPGDPELASGLTLDLGPAASGMLDTLNIEGAGAGGKRNRLMTRLDFGTFHIFSIEANADAVHLRVDGNAEGNRPRRAGTLGLGTYAVGARLYGAGGGVPRAQGFLNGGVAEIIAFDRELSEAERIRVERYLKDKYRVLLAQPSPVARSSGPAGSKALRPVVNPALVQWLAPGFEAKAAPVRLTNINFLRYRHDGVLVAGGYNGKIWLLRDTDGDGLEDHAAVYHESTGINVVMGMAVTPKGDPRGDGVFVATTGKVLFIPDRNGDGRGDGEELVATGWAPMRSGPQGSDAIGLTLDREGDIWFSLGTSDFVRAYLPDATTGEMGFRTTSERGTIQRVSADFKTRSTFATGVRFCVSLAFNGHGDLFATDQEGATWLPNGNPFDELLHIQRGRHYGFPPRHPWYLPDVIDEPSVVDFAPQHQSTCGFFFNEPAEGQPAFGPAWWRGDAFVTGESRGKVWRVELAKTAAGYVAQSHLVACLNMLTIDATLSPRGHLVAACHSGAPDWGSGPKGIGKIVHVRFLGSAPQPVVAWSAAPDTLRVAFDQPLPAHFTNGLAARADVTAGKYVAAGDRYEVLRPGYQVVQDQLAIPRFDVPVAETTLSPDRRTLAVRIAPRDQPENLALTLPPPAGREADGIDVLATLHGLAAEWRGDDGPAWTGWLPHPDLAVAREFTAASAEHDGLWLQLKARGTLKLRGQFDLWQMLHPPVQPGANLGYAYAPEALTLVFRAAAPFQLTAGGTAMSSTSKAGGHQAEVRFNSNRPGNWLGYELVTTTANPEISVHWFTAEDPRPRAFPLRRLLVPWARPGPDEPAVLAGNAERDIPEIRGGNWMRGQALFQGKAGCAACHHPNDANRSVGPDLALMSLAQRDYASVLKDVRDPNAAINPDFIAYTVEQIDNTSVVGTLKGEKDGMLRFWSPAGAHDVLRGQIKAMQAMPVSLMPPGLLDGLSEGERRDLFTFLLQPAFEPAPILVPGAPRPRKREEVAAVWRAAPPPVARENAPLRILLCAEGSGPHIKQGRHDYPLWRDRWSRLLGMAEGVNVQMAEKWPTAEQWRSHDIVVLYSDNSAWAKETEAAKVEALGRDLDGFLARGGGLVVLHFAVNGGVHAEALARRIGLAWPGPQGKFRHGANEWSLVPNHPLTAGLSHFRMPDESYWQLTGNLKAGEAEVICTIVEDGAPRPQVWTRQVGSGRVFVSIPGHFTWTFDDPLYRILIFRGMMWSGRQPLDRLAPLVNVGARMED